MEIDEIVEGFVPDRISYPPNSPIYELNQFGNSEITVNQYDEILAILAVLKYGEMNGDISEMELKFTESEIAGVVDRFFTFEYWYTYGNCPGRDCKKRTTTTIVDAGTELEHIIVTTTYYCDVNHRYLNGEVTNHSLEEVLASYNFSEEEQKLYEMYLAEIKLLKTGGG